MILHLIGNIRISHPIKLAIPTSSLSHSGIPRCTVPSIAIGEFIKKIQGSMKSANAIVVIR
jgi:hypothetical protein